MKEEPVIELLKKRWFDLILKEVYPKTPKITSELDNIEQGIRQLREPKPVLPILA